MARGEKVEMAKPKAQQPALFLEGELPPAPGVIEQQARHLVRTFIPSSSAVPPCVTT
jgi:hypothetical protein